MKNSMSKKNKNKKTKQNKKNHQITLAAERSLNTTVHIWKIETM